MRSSVLLARVSMIMVCASFVLAAPSHAQHAERVVLESKFELFVHDAASSIEFYGVLGFNVAHAKDYGYTTLKAGSTIVALSPLPWWFPAHWFGFLRYPPLGTELVLYTTQLEQTREAFNVAGYCPGDIELQSWGDRDFRIRDPDGYYVRITEGTAVPATPSAVPSE